MGTFSRRRFLSGTAAIVAAPFVARSSAAAQEVDVAIVGAGAAGLGAARRLQERGASFALLEAKGRIGGRVHTETETFGLPYDRGAHWLHGWPQNPFRSFAAENGFEAYKAPDGGYTLLADGAPQPQATRSALSQAWSRAESALGAAGRAGRDVSFAEVLPNGSAAERFVGTSIGLWSMGDDLDKLTTLDWWNNALEGGDGFCAEGYGSLIARFGAGIPVSLNSPVERISVGPDRVELYGPFGKVTAGSVILTVSTGMLAAEKIAISPRLPDWKIEAIEAVKMGSYNHVALLFDRDVFGLGPDRYAGRVADPTPKGAFLTNISGSNLVFMWTGGSVSRDLEKAGEAAAIEAGMEEVVACLGADAKKHLVKGAFTMWDSDPWTYGSYASALPAQFKERAMLRRPLFERLFFAGEACHPSLYQTVQGASASGATAANDAMRLLAE